MSNKGEFLTKSPFLHPSKKMLHKGCDCVVFCYYGGKYWFVLIELKSKDTSGAVVQLCCSSVFIRYLRELLFLHDGKEIRYELVYLLFSSRSNKMKTNLGNIKESRRTMRSPVDSNNLYYYNLSLPFPRFTLSRLLDCEPQTESPSPCDLFNRPRVVIPPSHIV